MPIWSIKTKARGSRLGSPRLIAMSSPLEFPRLDTSTAAERIALMLQSMIHQGKLNPGDRLPPERELCSLLGVGRVSVREAIKLLQAQGYVEVKRGPAGGSFISQLKEPYVGWLSKVRKELADYLDLIEVRVAVESRAAYLAAQRRDEDDLERMRAAVSLTSKATDRLQFRSADSEFHEALGRASRSRRLSDVISQTRGELFVRADELPFEDDIAATNDEHLMILEAIAASDPDKAAAAASTHINHTAEILVLTLSNDDGERLTSP